MTEEIFRKLNITWLFEEVSSFQEEKQLVDHDQDVNDIQENMADAFVPAEIEVENI